MGDVTDDQFNQKKDYCQGQNNVKLHGLQLSKPFFDRHRNPYLFNSTAPKKTIGISTANKNSLYLNYTKKVIMVVSTLNRREINSCVD